MYTEETDEYKDKNWQQFSKVSRMPELNSAQSRNLPRTVIVSMLTELMNMHNAQCTYCTKLMQFSLLTESSSEK